MSAKNYIYFLSLVVLQFAIAQVPPRINVPGAILVPSNNRQIPIRGQRILNPENIPLPIRVRKPIPNILPISIPIREEPEEDPRPLELDDDSDENVAFPKPIQFRPERPIPVLPVPIRQTLRQLDDEPPVIRQPVRQPPQQVSHPAPIPQQPIRQKVRVVASAKPIPQHLDDDVRRNKNRKPVVQILRKYRTDNEDGSITWGYENEDGSFKEETIGADCIIRGKYGYIDPEGTRREYSYETGNKCEPQEEELPLDDPKNRPLKKPYKI